MTDTKADKENVKFATMANTYKFYFTNRGESKLDYPAIFIGTMTPSTFTWTKMRHLYDIMDAVRNDPDDKIPIIKSGETNFTALQFLQEIADIRMWMFNKGL